LLTTLLTGTLITIKTTLMDYDDMVLESLEITRNKDKGNALYLNATAVQVRLVTLQESEAARPVDQSTKNRGKKSTKAADSSTASGTRSFLKSVSR
jgi:hypothetical protein